MNGQDGDYITGDLAIKSFATPVIAFQAGCGIVSLQDIHKFCGKACGNQVSQPG